MHHTPALIVILLFALTTSISVVFGEGEVELFMIHGNDAAKNWFNKAVASMDAVQDEL